MKVLKIVLLLIAFIVLVLFLMLMQAGIFKTVTASEKVMGPYTLVYESYKGDYNNTGKVFDRVYRKLKADGIITSRGLGVYYDDPATTPAGQQRSDCGSVIEEADLQKLEAVKAKYNVMQILKKECIVVEFPFKNYLTYMLGPSKAYPVMVNFAMKKGYKVTRAYELYDNPGKLVYYVFEINK